MKMPTEHDQALEGNFNPDVHDGLVLVHPSYNLEMITETYLANLRSAVEKAAAINCPVFYCADEFGDPAPAIKEILAIGSARTSPNYMGYSKYAKAKYVRRRVQKEVDEICGIIGKPCNEIILGFGGMYANACVSIWAQTWCQRVKSAWAPEYIEFAQFRPRHSFRCGDILSRLVIAL
jgi:hypothetical protein